MIKPLLEVKIKNKYERLFYIYLLEYLSQNDPILHAQEYFEKERKDKFDINKRRKYVNEFPVKDIKKDLHKFIKKFDKTLLSIPEIEKCAPDPSPSWGFSNYVYITFRKPTDPKLSDYYDEHEDEYKHVKIKFSDHTRIKTTKDKNGNKVEIPAEEKETNKSKMNVDWYGKTFKAASNEMLGKIKAYIQNLHDGENKYLQSLENEEDGEENKDSEATVSEKETQDIENNETHDNNETSTKEESLKLKIRESYEPTIKLRIRERVEQDSSGIFITDLAGDVVNLLMNKPKPYRIIWDKKYDVYALAEATGKTHKQITFDLFKSGYLYNVAKDLDRDIHYMRYSSDEIEDWEVYADCGWNSGDILGLIFIPTDYDYFKYEKTGFYSIKTELITGTLYSRYYFQSTFRDLYRKLEQRGALLPDAETQLQMIWDSTEKFADRKYVFTDRAYAAGFKKGEINDWLFNNVD